MTEMSLVHVIGLQVLWFHNVFSDVKLGWFMYVLVSVADRGLTSPLPRHGSCCPHNHQRGGCKSFVQGMASVCYWSGKIPETLLFFREEFV